MQGQLLESAAEELHKCQDLEVALFEMADPADVSTRRTNPLRPLLLNRTATSATFSHFPFKLRAGRATTFSVYGKAFGAGVSLSINRTAAEYEGTGVMAPVGGRITVRGLKPNDTYMFAVAAYDGAGKLLGGLGAQLPKVERIVYCEFHASSITTVRSALSLGAYQTHWLICTVRLDTSCFETYARWEMIVLVPKACSA
jgi:hypothetical protein